MASSATVEIWESASLEEHVSLIQRQFRKSLRDGELRQLAAKIVSNKPDDFTADPRTGLEIPVVIAWGEAFRLPQTALCGMKDAQCESQALWDFYILNMRYVLDPDGYDLFMTAKRALQSGAGDCDDAVITLGALHKMVGFQNLRARVVSTNGKFWEHIYLLVGLPKTGQVRQWLPLDPTVPGAIPGWQYDKIKAYQDFEL
jgi:hypothetical protein